MSFDTQITRQLEAYSFALTAALATTPEIDVRRFSYGSVINPSGSAITSLASFYGAVSPGGTYCLITDVTSQSIAANTAAALDAKLFGYGAIKIVVDSPGDATVIMKS